MKIKGWLHIEDGGDGSANVKFFRTHQEAQTSADQEMNEYGQALCDNVVPFEIEVDDDGLIIG